MIYIVIRLLDDLDDLDRDLPNVLIYFYLKTYNKPLPWHGVFVLLSFYVAGSIYAAADDSM